MKLLNFIQKFPTEKECVSYYRKIRELRGVSCDRCGNEAHSWQRGDDTFTCAACGNTIPLRAGTIMEDSDLPLKFWFLGIFLATHPDKSYTYEEIMRKLDYLHDESISSMLDKVGELKRKLGNINDFDILLHSSAGGI